MISNKYLFKIFKLSPTPALVLHADPPAFTIAGVNDAYLSATRSSEPDLLGKGIFEAFPGNSADKEANGRSNLRRSLEKVLQTGKVDKMNVQQYDIPVRGTNSFEEKYWQPANFPVLNEKNEVIYIVHTVDEHVAHKEELEDLLHRANSLARIGSWEVDLVKGTVYWSDITREIHEADSGFVPDLGIGINFYKAGKNREIIRQKIREGMENGTPWDLELQIVTAKGNDRWIRTIGEVEQKDGKCVRIFGSFQDIDARKKAEIAVTEALAEKNTILESIGDAFIALDKNWVVTYWNKQAEEVLGKPRHEIIGRNVWEVYADAVNPFLTHYQQAIKDNTVRHFEEYYETLDVWLEVSAYPSENGLSVYFNNVTERKKVMDALRSSNERYDTAAKATNDSIWDWDLLKNEVVRPGKRLEGLLGYKEVEAANVDTFWRSHVHPEDWERMCLHRQKLFGDPQQNYWEDEYRFLKPDGQYAYINDKAYIMRDTEGKAVRMIGASRDITREKERLNEIIRIKQNLEIQNEKLREIAWLQSHMVRAPLTKLMGLIDLIRNFDNSRKERFELLDLVLKSAHELDTIIRDISNKSEQIKTNDA